LKEGDKMQQLPLANIRVLDFTQVRVGPQFTQWLAVMGAEVIRVETKTRPESFKMTNNPGNITAPVKYRVGYFASLNYSKQSITINMKSPKSFELIKDLLKHIDIVAENFRTGVMERWGMGYNDLKKINPGIILLSASGFGRTGPMKDEPAYAPVIDGFSGYSYVNGYPDGEPAEAGARGFSDSIAAYQGVFAVMAALYHRSKTGEGQFLDLSMSEADVALGPEAIIEYAVTGRVQQRLGNSDKHMAPHNIYRCLGEDNWIAIAVSNEKEWKGLCKAIGNPKWTKDNKFSDAAGRRTHKDELDALIETWTAKHDHYEAMKILQQAGVIAGASLKVEEFCSDPHIKERGFLIDIEYPDKSSIRRSALPFNLSGSGKGNYTHPPEAGENNRYVFGTIMGLSPEKIKELEKEQVIY
jgi:crotonobetainyl-CoA:carnitine CoA-transferase CaiB-like acyl-CoA transferase